MNQTLEQKAVEIVSQIQHLAPKATDLALRTAQINAISNLIFGIIWLLIFGSAYLFWRKVYWPWVRRHDQDCIDGPFASFCGGVALVILMAISGGISISALGDIWTYIGIFHPELALAHKLI